MESVKELFFDSRRDLTSHEKKWAFDCRSVLDEKAQEIALMQ
uniref:Uncharacterized protein n=1 Tax=Pristionchus pacificus TaxID=54126 RepID=A0A2A6CEL1_PRIPA